MKLNWNYHRMFEKGDHVNLVKDVVLKKQGANRNIKISKLELLLVVDYENYVRGDLRYRLQRENGDYLNYIPEYLMESI